MRSINKQPKKPAFIFSVYNTNRDEEYNLQVHDATLKHLQLNKAQYKVLEGRYKHDNGETVEELSFYVQPSEKLDYEALKAIVKERCDMTEQEFYLQIDAKRNTNLIYMDKDGDSAIEYLGVLTPVSKTEAVSSPAYSYDKATDQYFVAK